MACAKTLASRNEYKKWILIYVRQLALISDFKVLKEICDEFKLQLGKNNINNDNKDKMIVDLDENNGDKGGIEFLTLVEQKQLFQQILQIIQTNQNSNILLENNTTNENI